MKSLLIASLLIGSISSYAITDFEQALSENKILFEGSKNYGAKYVNDDGSVTIVKPKFSNPDGSGSLRLSATTESNLAGICKLFGAGSYVSNSSRYEYASGTLVSISSDGTFERFDFSKNIQALKSLICLPSTQPEVGPSDNAENILRNDDGSVTIVKPKFSNPDGSGSLRLSATTESNLAGICKLFGAGSYVSNSSRYEYASGTLVSISSDGTFERFDFSKNIQALKSLICRH